MEDFELNVDHSRGYSFCNCRNIFYTDYKNIDKSIYDEAYNKNYEESEDTKLVAKNEIEKLFPRMLKFAKDAKVFFEIGSIHDHVLDHAHEKGLEVHSLNINTRESKHNLVVKDFEDLVPSELSFKPDIIYASHIFEHFKDPAKELDKCLEMLSPGGIIYIAMPDTFFANFEAGTAQNFDWMIQEHHILWNMDNWIEYVEERGFKCVYKERGLDLHKQKNGKWFWKQDYKIICQK
jgi:SAM-dependent methyltransferase